MPVPDSPVISTRVSVFATMRACWRHASIAGLRVMISALHSSRALRHAGDLHGALDVLEQLLLVDGLRQEAERAALRRLDGVGNRAVRRQQQHAEPGPLALDLLQQLDAVHVVHAQVA